MKMLERRTLVRMAVKLQAAYDRPCESPLLPEPPLPHWESVLQAYRQQQLCRGHQLSVAAHELQERYRHQLDRLAAHCRDAARRLEPSFLEGDVPTVRLLYEELQGLSAEFDQVQLDLRMQTVSVQTPPIVLEELNLGPFEICLRGTSLGEEHPTYEVRALQPCYASGSDQHPHPHVHKSILCEGEGRTPIRAALQEGRLCDFFLLISQILATYNSSSAYVQLGDWEGVSCLDCDQLMQVREADSCRECGSPLCSECVHNCGGCCCSLCHDCQAACQRCDDACCPACLKECSDCGDSYCNSCLTDGCCDDCFETQQENADDEFDSQAPAAIAPATATPARETPAASATEIHADRLGETPLPA